MSDFDEFERQLNENKQGEGAGGAGRRAGRLLASLRVPRHFTPLFPLLSGPRGVPPPRLRGARLAHVTARRAAARGRGGGGGRGSRTHARRSSCCAPRGPRRRWRGLAGCFFAESPRPFLLLLFFSSLNNLKGGCMCIKSRNASFLSRCPGTSGSGRAHGPSLHAPFVPKWRLRAPLHVGAGRGDPRAGAASVPRCPS